MSKKGILIALVMISFSSLLVAQDEEPNIVPVEYHIRGDQVFSIDAGLFLPLFFLDFSSGDNDGKAFSKTNLTLGGAGFLSYTGYINGNMRIGGEFGGVFAYSPNENVFSMIPISVKGAYEFNLGPQFTIPIFLSVGISLTNYLDNFRVDPLIKPGVGFYWNYNSEWSFGAKYDYWIVPEIFGNNPEYNIVGNFSNVCLSVEYHF